MKILVAIDGSEHALRALQQALSLRAAMSTPPSLVLVNVHMSPIHGPATRLISQEQLNAYMDEVAETELKDARAVLDGQGISYDVIKRHGEVAGGIVQAARDTGADLIIMGAKGRGSMIDLLMGSVATKVASASPVSVLLAK